MAVNIYTTGGAGDGKTTLSAAFMFCLGSEYPNLNGSPVAGADGSGVARESCATPAHRYAMTDAPASGCAAMLASSPKMDVALLVVAANEGPQKGTVAAIDGAKAAGVPGIVVYFSKCDLVPDEELLELLELEIRELLSSRGYSGDDLSVVSGNAKDALTSSGSRTDKKAASIFALADAIDKAVPAGVT
jgi:elongation factor Tu